MAGKSKIGQFLKSRGSNQKEAAAVLGMHHSTFSIKANGFTDDEIAKLAEHYKMTDWEISEVFK